MAVDVYEAATFEALWPHFASVVRAPLSDPLQSETVIVPGRGWPHWLTRRLARQLGSCSGFEFLSTGQWMSQTLESLLGRERAPRREADSLTWHIASLLPQLSADQDFASLRRYLFQNDSEPDMQRLIDLSRQIGGLFDRYLLFRPELITAWEPSADGTESDSLTASPVDGPEPDIAWQKKLWQGIVAASGYRPVAAMITDLAEHLRQLPDQTRREQLPERLTVWMTGCSPPAAFSLMEVLGRYTDISIFSLVPAAHYWSDMQGRRDLLRRLRDSRQSLHEFCRQNHVYLLHPLLASLGESSRQQQMLMVDCETDPWRLREVTEAATEPREPSRGGCSESASEPGSHQKPVLSRQSSTDTSSQLLLFSDHDEDEPEAPVTQTLLEWIQAGIRQAREPRAQALPRDSSLQIHSCHSTMREIEVLHDTLRAAFEDDPQLTPEDVVVLSPELDTCAPLIHAVFGGSSRHPDGRIPYQIAGDSRHSQLPAVNAWLRLTAALQSRFPASVVLDLLACDPVRERAGLDARDVAQIAGWIADAGIRWGLDAPHRAAEGLPASDLNTWQFGLDRLLMGYALPPPGGQLVGDSAALDRVEGLDAATLGRFAALIERLSDWKELLKSPRPVAQWPALLSRLTEAFLDTDTDETGIRHLLRALTTVAGLARDAGFEAPVPVSLMVREVERLAAESAGTSFRAAGVTFCRLEALRRLPHRVVALIGMNEGSFPRRDRALSFDLMARQPRPGEITPRNEDRQLFLDALLSAGDRVIVTYQGQDVRNSATRSPSIVVDELLDLLERCDQPRSTDLPGIRDVVHIRHPLQRFSPACFDGRDGRLFSFDAASLEAARRLAGPRKPAPVFASPLPENTSEFREIRIEELQQLLTAPWKLFLAETGIRSLDLQSGVDDDQALLLDGLESWKIGDRWLKQRLMDGQSEDTIRRTLQRSGLTPDGSFGALVLDRIGGNIEGILAQMEDLQFTPGGERLAIDLDLNGFHITGHLDFWSPAGLRAVTASKINVRQQLRLWLHQLIAAASRDSRCPPALLLGNHHSRFGIRAMDPAEAQAQLTRLGELVETGRRFPLFYLPADAAVKPVRSHKVQFDVEESVRAFLTQARRYLNEARGHADVPGEDPHIRAAFAGVDPLELTCEGIPGLEMYGDENLFVRMVREISVPMLDAAEAPV